MAAAAASAASATGGFRGPAKRAAFGDMTNMTKNTAGGAHDGKYVKLQTTSGAPNTALINKENVPYNRGGKEPLSRPAQRQSTILSSKPNGMVFPDAVKKSTTGVAQDVNTAASSANTGRTGGAAARSRTANASDKEVFLPSSTASFDAPPLQPRHYKSQPQLKQQRQPMLRRTQSKQFEGVECTIDKSTRVSEAARLSEAARVSAATAGYDLVGMPASILEEICADFPCRVDEFELPSGLVDDVDEYFELPPKFGHMAQDPQQIHIASKESLTRALSEPEEYWEEEEEEEEEEDYDDQDQAYTTAHSFRSQNLTTGGVTTILAPRVTSKVQRELEEAKLEVQQTRSMDDIEEEMWDVSMVAEYGEEIFEYMRELEVQMQPNPHYMEMQTEIQWSMRSVLMDWLVQVHNRFSLLPETLFLTVNYIDRFLSYKIVSIGKLQLVGATAILIASKYEEINCPSLDEIVYMVDGGYTTDEILKAERFMLSMLNFELGWPGPMSFLRRVSKADDYDLDTRTLAKYFLELTIMDERFVSSPPSFLAAGAHCLSRLILKKGDWSKAHVHYSGYTWVQLRPLVTMIIDCCERPRLHHAAVFEKYQERRFKEASTVVQHALDAGFTLPHRTVAVRSQPGRADDLSDSLIFPNGLLVPTEG
ncbi:B-type cyclin [Conoideocrella luteorostrata]|uniref:B-type cyclin n=1 Tax=Conoideocrella luteorostrata TaxID=1105319 RepID=A0AAJ0CS30_9HYPO|nr:B-type cyclin [Conoideocrella luteorostrata]